MRVVHIGKFFPPHPGGIERTCADLCTGLAVDGVATAVLAHAEPGSWRGRRFLDGDVDITLTACLGQWLYAPVSPDFGWRLSRLIAEFKPDLLHLHLPNTSAFWALMIPAARRLPWIIHWHADIPLDSQRRGLRLAYRVYRPWEQALLRRARVVIATSAAYRDSSAALVPWLDKTRVIPLGLPSLARPDSDPTALNPTASGESAGVREHGPDDSSTQTEAPPPHPTLSPIASDGGEGNAGAGVPIHIAIERLPTPNGTTPSPPTMSGERVGVRGRRPSDASTQTEAASLHPARSGIASNGGEGKEISWPSTGLRLLGVGRLSYFKGFDVLLRALAQVAQASLVLIGDGECAASLKQLADELGITDRVNFAGRIDMDAAGETRMAHAYAHCDVFCLPSTERAESFGLVLLEAMRAGKATIASDISGSGVGFVVRDGDTGILVAPGDIAALIDAIQRLQADARLRQRLGQAGQLRWQHEFTLERSTQRILALYREVLAG